MTPSTEAILADLKVKRDLHSVLDVSYRDYWRTFAMIALYLAGFAYCEIDVHARISAVIYFLAACLLVCAAINDSQVAMKRRWSLLIALLEKKGLL